MRKTLLLLCVFLFGGCTTINIAQLKEEYAIRPTPALALQIKEAVIAKGERDLKRAQTYENWQLCEAILKHFKVVTWHIGHSHSGLNANRVRYYDVQRDLLTNNCRSIVPDHLWQPARD